MAEVFEDSYSSEALQNMEEFMFTFGDTIKDIGSEDAFKNALFGMKVIIEKKPRRIADIAKVMVGTKPRLESDAFRLSRDEERAWFVVQTFIELIDNGLQT